MRKQKVKQDEGMIHKRLVSGPDLYYSTLIPKSPKAFVGIIHGYAEHSGRYLHVREAWAKQGIASIAIDLRGHGKSEGRQGHCDNFSDFLEDVDELKKLLKEHANGKPCFLFGHSLGGLIVAKSTQESSTFWAGIILSGPFFGLAVKVPLAKKIAARIALIFWEHLALPAGVKGAELTHEATFAKAYDMDPLVFKKASVRFYFEFIKAQEEALANAAQLHLPLYLAIGEFDSIVKVSSAKEFFDKTSSKDKSWDLRQGLLHEVLNEAIWPELANTIGDWMLARA